MNINDYESVGEELYEDFASEVRTLVKSAIAKHKNLPVLQSTKSRGKTTDSLHRKLKERSLSASENIENEIKDLAGVRLIFYTDTDVDAFLQSRIISDTFAVHWEEMKVHYPTNENEQTRYRGFHYTISLSEKQLEKAKYQRFKGLRCEIQIQTILNHAWSESSHDMIYKPRGSEGFGSKARERLTARMKKIMDDHLRVAGFEFQQAQKEYEHLMKGKELFDQDPFEKLEQCKDNNERYEILSIILEHLLPYYDDIDTIYPAIRSGMAKAIATAQVSKTKPIKAGRIKFPGKTAKDIVSLCVKILNELRYVDIKATFQSLIELYSTQSDAETRAQIIEVIKRFSKYDLQVWEQIGPHVQKKLTEQIAELSQEKRAAVRPILFAAWRQFLNAELQGSRFSAESVTISTGAVPATEDIKYIRDRAIDGLMEMYNVSSTEPELGEVLTTLRTATRLPTQGERSNALMRLALENTLRITEFISAQVDRLSYFQISSQEHRMLFDYHRAEELADEAQSRFECMDIARKVADSILRFRDKINQDENFVKYKTLVGFESTFPQHWTDEHFDFKAEEQYRKEEIERYVESISDQNIQQWYELIEQCASTKSDDMATFPLFGEFLNMLSQRKPKLALQVFSKRNTVVVPFLPAFLNGLYKSGEPEIYQKVVATLLRKRTSLAGIALHCRQAGAAACDIIKSVLGEAIKHDERGALFQCVAFAVEFHNPETLPLMDDVFMVAVRHLEQKNDARWVNGIWYMPATKEFLRKLPLANAEIILRNLLTVQTVDYHAERILAGLAESYPKEVWRFFRLRVENKKEDADARYEAIPHELHELRSSMQQPEIALEILREWYDPKDHMFRFTGGRLLHAVFPTFTSPLANELIGSLDTTSESAANFVVALLENYTGEAGVQEVVKHLVDTVTDLTQISGRLEICLDSTGVVGGAFGMVEAHREKRNAMEFWLNDSRPKVREYASARMRSMEQRIASEQRSAESRQELRRREYED